jgi:hypothetical protein
MDPLIDVTIKPPPGGPLVRWTATVQRLGAGGGVHERTVPSHRSHRHLDALMRDIHAELIDSQGRPR